MRSASNTRSAQPPRAVLCNAPAASPSAARYGEFRVDCASGEAVLVGLRDQALKAR